MMKRMNIDSNTDKLHEPKTRQIPLTFCQTMESLLEKSVKATPAMSQSAEMLHLLYKIWASNTNPHCSFNNRSIGFS